MKTRLKILPAVCCIAMLSACASNKTVSQAPGSDTATASWSVKPMAIKTSNDNPEAMYQMGRYYQGQNRYDLAITAYQKALAADNGFVEARNGMGVVYSRQGKYREAIEVFQAAIKQAPKAAHLYSNLGYAYYLQGQYAESVVALEQATVLDPANQRALNNLGLAYAKAGSKPESVQAFSQAANAASVVPNSVSPVTAEAAQNIPSSITTSATTSVEASATITPAHAVPKQELTLPKDRGVIRSASSVAPVAVVNSRIKLVQVAPNVHEWHETQYKPVQVANTPVMMTDDKQMTKKVRLEVANGNGVTGMAGKVGQFLQNQGYPAVRLTNQKPFKVHMTQIQYREGYQAAAQLLKISLPEAPELVQRNDLRADIAVRLLLGKDVATRVASFDRKQQKLQLALNAS